MAAPSIDDRAIPLAVYDEALDKMVPVTKAGGLGGVSDETEIIDNTGANLYEGYAPFGTATSAAAWKIRRTPISGSVTGPTQRADGNDNYDNVWDNRATLSYT